jgi:hypothetical protein
MEMLIEERPFIKLWRVHSLLIVCISVQMCGKIAVLYKIAAASYFLPFLIAQSLKRRIIITFGP